MGKCSVWIVNLLRFDEVKLKINKRYNFTQIYRLFLVT